ncbi:unnamed protein product, partial [Owenia fusiformis]
VIVIAVGGSVGGSVGATVVCTSQEHLTFRLQFGTSGHRHVVPSSHTPFALKTPFFFTSPHFSPSLFSLLLLLLLPLPLSLDYWKKYNMYIVFINGMIMFGH